MQCYCRIAAEQTHETVKPTVMLFARQKSRQLNGLQLMLERYLARGTMEKNNMKFTLGIPFLFIALMFVIVIKIFLQMMNPYVFDISELKSNLNEWTF